MFRTSGFLAIALGVTAIGSATAPAAAFSSQYPGDAKHVSAQSHAGPASTSMQPKSLPAKISVSVGSQATSPIKAKLPMPNDPGGVGKKLGPVGVPVALLPPPPPPIVKVLPPFPKFPHPIDDICPDNPTKCPPKPIGNPGNPGNPPGGQPNGNGGTVLILVPQVPVEVPVAIPVAVPARVGTATGSYAGQARPSIASQCSTAGNIPALAAGIDQLLPTAQLSETDITKVTELRQMIQLLSVDGKVGAARDVEEIAMRLLGYRKAWLLCGLGTFDWEQQVASTEAGQAK